MGVPLPRGEKVIVFRFVDDSEQGFTEDWSPALADRLAVLGNPVRLTFDCWRRFGVFGVNPIAIGGVPYSFGGNPSREGAFSERPSRPNPLEFAVPR